MGNESNDKSIVMRAASLFDGLSPDAQRMAKSSKTANTVRSYEGAWRRFLAWCDTHSLSALPATPETVCNYLTERSKTVSASTITVDRSAIRSAHEIALLPSPTTAAKVKIVCEGIHRELGVRPDAKTPLPGEDVSLLVAKLPNTLSGVRDRALLLIGFAGAFRRSELVAICMGDLTFDRGGNAVEIVMPKSKTDQSGKGLEKAIQGIGGSSCPIAALQAWIKVAGIRGGPVFRRVLSRGRVTNEALTAAYVAKLVKRMAKACGLNHELYSGHSLRSGFVTDAAMKGLTIYEIQDQTKHKSVDVLMTYVRRTTRMNTNITARLGLAKDNGDGKK